MSDQRLSARSVAAIAIAAATLGIAAPLATADPAPQFIPQTGTVPPNSLRANTPHLGEGLTGADRSWLPARSGDGHATTFWSNFDWGSAGIGAGGAVIVLLAATGSAVEIRRRMSPVH